jgi:sugar lactone lactonase YvrE
MYGTVRWIAVVCLSFVAMAPSLWAAEKISESATTSEAAGELESAPKAAKSSPGSPTHKQSALIKVNAEGLPTATVACFCLGKDEALLAGCTGASKEIRVFDRDGKYVKSIELPVSPEAINVAPDETILVAGEGQLMRLSAEGDELALVDSPHAANIRESEEKIREEVLAQHKEQFKMRPQMIEAYNNAIDTMKKQVDRLTKQEEELRKQLDDDEGDKKLSAQLKRIERQLNTAEQNISQYEEAKKQFEEQAGDGDEPAELTDEQIAEKVAASMKYKLTVASISATKEAVFIACRAPVGYGYNVWRLTPDFAEGEQIVEGLSGCCGQMDVQASDEGIFVAENSRHRVCRYDAEGKLIETWGKGARTGIEGFGSCCNPMNLAFGNGGVVYTAEDTTGRIKRYTPDGKLLSVVGAADVVPGCKKVAIGVAADGDRVYMLDITRNHIAQLDRVAPDPEGPIGDEDAPSSSGSIGGALLRAFGLGGN